MTHHQDYNPEDGFDDNDIRELLPLYALGGLTEEEARLLEVALHRDPFLEAELADLTETTVLLPLAVPPMQPSAEMTADLMSRVEKSAVHRFKAPAATSQASPIARVEPESESGGLAAFLSFLFTTPLVTGAAMAGFVAMVGMVWFLNQQVSTLKSDLVALESNSVTAAAERETLIAKNEILEGQVVSLEDDRHTLEDQLIQQGTANDTLEEQLAALVEERDELAASLAAIESSNTEMLAEAAEIEERLAETERVVSLFDSPNSQLYEVGGTELEPEATGQVIIDPESDVAILSVSNLPPLAEDEVYQVLLIRGSEHDTAETFEVNSSGEDFIVIHAPFPFSTFDTLGVSIEPSGGSFQRTGEIVLLGALIN
ncbi:MAG: anti-sigma factor [Ardenticatenaceae bacterium]|nr:anti-sigma factor [Ardenticatenaceae bacterium]